MLNVSHIKSNADKNHIDIFLTYQIGKHSKAWLLILLSTHLLLVGLQNGTYSLEGIVII